MVTEDIKFVKTSSSKLEEVQGDYPNSFIHVHDGNDDNLYIGEDRITDNLNIGDLDTSIATQAVGGLKPSTIGKLKQKSVSEILLDMVCPVIEPTHTNPSITVSYSGDRLIEVGSTLPLDDEIILTTDNGSWSDGTVYSGGSDDITLSMNPSDWGMESEEKIYTISANGTFKEGGIPKDNHNTSYPDLKYQGGNIIYSNIITITSVKPIYINDGESITTYVKHIVNYNSNIELEVTIPAEVETPTIEKFTVYLPGMFTSFVVNQYNPLTDKYDIPIPMVETESDRDGFVKFVRNDGGTKVLATRYKINLRK